MAAVVVEHREQLTFVFDRLTFGFVVAQQAGRGALPSVEDEVDETCSGFARCSELDRTQAVDAGKHDIQSRSGRSLGSCPVAEEDVIGSTAAPETAESLAADLARLGVGAGDVLVVHASLRSIGWVVGGAAAVVDALLAAVGPTGTVTMPAHSTDWSDPSEWENPPVPPTWWNAIIENRPAFDPYATPMRGMGAIAENLLMRRATLRSTHPLHSHMAHGPAAAAIVADHALEHSFGDRSPLGRLYGLDAKILLVGVGHGSNTSLHLAESRAEWPTKSAREQVSRVNADGVPRVVRWSSGPVDADDFEILGGHLDDSGLVTMGTLGRASARVMGQRAVVDAAVPWFEQHRG